MCSDNEDDTTECRRPPFRRRALPPSLYLGIEGNYSVGEDSLTLFSLKVDKEDDQDNPSEDKADPLEDQDDPPEDITFSDINPDMCDDETPTPLVFWSPAAGGHVHPNAVRVSTDLDGGPLYVGRAVAQGELLPGKIAVRHQVCYVAYEGKEEAYRGYEVLVLQRGRVEWVPCKDGEFPAYALRAGLTLQGKAVYCARARVDKIMTPGMLVSGEKICRISYNMREFTFSEYEVLTVRCLNPNEFNGDFRYVPDPM